MTIIREGVIRIRYEQQKAKLEAPDTGPSQRAFEAEKKAADEAKKSIEGVTAATKENSATTKRAVDENRVNLEAGRLAAERYAVKSVSAFRESGEGALRLARGLAFLAASGSDDMKKLAQGIAIAAGSFDVLSGASKVVTSLLPILGGPFTAAITAVTAVVTVGTVVWGKYRAELEDNRKAAREAADAIRDIAKAEEERQNRARSRSSDARSALADLRIRGAISPENREAALLAESARLRREQGALSAEDAGITSALAKPRGGRFGETSPELAALIKQFGGPEGIRDRQEIVAREREEGVRRLIDVEEQLFRVRQDQLRDAEQAAKNNIAGVPILPGGGPADFSARNQALVVQAEQTFAELTRVFTDAQRRLQQIENAQDH